MLNAAAVDDNHDDDHHDHGFQEFSFTYIISKFSSTYIIYKCREKNY